MPEHVVDYVLLHELVHLLVPGHGADFEAWMQRYPRLLEARAFLAGVDHATGHGLDSAGGSDVDDDADAQDPDDADEPERDPPPMPRAAAAALAEPAPTRTARSTSPTC